MEHTGLSYLSSIAGGLWSGGTPTLPRFWPGAHRRGARPDSPPYAAAKPDPFCGPAELIAETAGGRCRPVRSPLRP